MSLVSGHTFFPSKIYCSNPQTDRKGNHYYFFTNFYLFLGIQAIGEVCHVRQRIDAPAPAFQVAAQQQMALVRNHSSWGIRCHQKNRFPVDSSCFDKGQRPVVSSWSNMYHFALSAPREVAEAGRTCWGFFHWAVAFKQIGTWSETWCLSVHSYCYYYCYYYCCLWLPDYHDHSMVTII